MGTEPHEEGKAHSAPRSEAPSCAGRTIPELGTNSPDWLRVRLLSTTGMKSRKLFLGFFSR